MWKDVVGFVLVIAALGGLGYGVSQISARDYVAAALLLIAGASTLRAGVGLLRPTVGE
jgi:hypothetical protein